MLTNTETTAGKPVVLVRIAGNSNGGPSLICDADGLAEWRRQSGESVDAFRARAKVEAALTSPDGCGVIVLAEVA